MKITNNLKGQMRVVETILASFIILFALAFVNMLAVTPSSITYEATELEKIGHNVLHDLDEQRLLGRFIFYHEWSNFTAALMVSLPPDVYFNLTVYDSRGNVVNSVPIRYGDPEVFTTASMVASVSYGVPGYQTNYDPRIIILQLVRG